MSRADRKNIGEVASALRHGLDLTRREERDKQGHPKTQPDAEFWDEVTRWYKRLFEEDYADFNGGQFTRVAGQGEDRYSR